MNRIKIFVPRLCKRQAKHVFKNAWESIAYRCSRARLRKKLVRHVVFVCKGNVCRSPFAEHYLRSRLSGDAMKLESCGLDVDRSVCSPPDAIQVSKEFGVDLSFSRSKGLTACDLHNADLIVPMEFSHYLRLRTMFPEMHGKIKLLREFAPWPDRLLFNFRDPYGSGPGEFRRCFRKMQRALDGLKSWIENNE